MAYLRECLERVRGQRIWSPDHGVSPVGDGLSSLRVPGTDAYARSDAAFEVSNSVHVASPCIHSMAELARLVREADATSAWLTVDSAMVENFVCAMQASPFPARHVSSSVSDSTSVAHGLLLLSLVPTMARTAAPNIDGVRKGINIGFEQVTFLAPVQVNSRVRGRFVLADMTEPEAGFYRVTYDVTIESECDLRPAAAARWIVGYWVAG